MNAVKTRLYRPDRELIARMKSRSIASVTVWSALSKLGVRRVIGRE